MSPCSRVNKNKKCDDPDDETANELECLWWLSGGEGGDMKKVKNYMEQHRVWYYFCKECLFWYFYYEKGSCHDGLNEDTENNNN